MNELIERINKALVEKNNYLNEIDGISIFGSIARGNYDEYSDIDVFVVVKPEYDDKDGCALHNKWHHRIQDMLSEFRRGITVLVYSIPSLKKYPPGPHLDYHQKEYLLMTLKEKSRKYLKQ